VHQQVAERDALEVVCFRGDVLADRVVEAEELFFVQDERERGSEDLRDGPDEEFAVET
jgi:hypothetical protein